MRKLAVALVLGAFVSTTLSFGSTAGTAIPRPEHPRPQFERADWINLNGQWTYTFDFGLSGTSRGYMGSEGFEGTITVPYCPESRLSGVAYTDYINGMWYQRKVDIPASWEGKRIIMHFGGVDYYSVLYVNGKLAGRHWGGMSSFEFDITRFVEAGGTANMVLRVEDDIRSNVQPGGKQSHAYASAGCNYTRVTGIWQTVWMEAVAPCGLKGVYVKPDFDNSAFVFEPSFLGLRDGQSLRVKVFDGSKLAASSTAKAATPMTMVIPIRKARAWSPEDPFLYDIEYEVLDASGTVIDKVSSYAGMRKVHIEGNRLYLNNRPIFLRMVLDQGFYPEGIWTAPTDEDLKNDILRSQAVGFNGARLHQKVFEERFHYWADKLGYLTWGEASSWGIDVNSELAARNFIGEWEDIVVRDRNHPSIIVWTPFNESWGRSGNEEGARIHDRLINDIYRLTHYIDYRPVHDSSGGYHIVTDIWSYHNYNQNPEELKRQLTLKGDGTVPTYSPEKECPYSDQPYFLDEYGGIGWVIRKYAENSWGYGNAPASLEELYTRLEGLTDAILSLDYISGFCYTQLTDVEQEQNGIYTYGREAKFDTDRLKSIFGRTPAWAK